ncbi:MAG: hypothetical protein Q8M24_16245 [Pseudolabrys sp.]|nr:hypothetical protein [Pseudolabrys sp.]MDP2296994.1 hypothetical protein [Pseudolabrys sp.]
MAGFLEHRRGVTPYFLSLPRTAISIQPMGDSVRALPITDQGRDTGANGHALACNTQNSGHNALPFAGQRPTATAPYVEFKLAPPVVAGTILTGAEIGFLEFLTDPASADYCELLLGGQATSAATMLREFRKATEFHFFGHRHAKPGRKKPRNPGMLTAPASATKKLLKKYARLAYRGDPERRGVAFWERVAWLVWNCYATLMALRCRAETIRQQELKRMADLPTKRAGRTEYMRGYRAKQRTNTASHTKTETEEA